MAREVIGTFKCPHCGKDNEVTTDGPAECTNCHGKHSIDVQNKDIGIFEKHILRLGARRSKRIFEGLTKSKIQTPRMTINKTIAKAVALGVHSISVVFLCLGIAMLRLWPNPVAVIMTATLFVLSCAIAWILRSQNEAAKIASE